MIFSRSADSPASRRGRRGSGSILGTPAEAHAETIAVTDFVYTCPLCGQKTTDYDALVKHFEETHPQAAVPAAAALSINGVDFKVQVEPHWTLRETLLKADDRPLHTR